MLNRILKRDESRCLNVRKRKETKELRGIQSSITFIEDFHISRLKLILIIVRIRMIRESFLFLSKIRDNFRRSLHA